MNSTENLNNFYVDIEHLDNFSNLELNKKILPEHASYAIPSKDSSVISKYMSGLFVQYVPLTVSDSHLAQTSSAGRSSKPVYLPLLDNAKFVKTIGNLVGSGASARIFEVDHFSIKKSSRIYRIILLRENKGEDEFLAQKLAGDHGIGPYFYGAALLHEEKNKYKVVFEMDFIKRKFYFYPELHACSLVKKIKELLKLKIIQGDIGISNILIDENKKLFIIDYEQAKIFQTTGEALQYLIENNKNSIHSEVYEIVNLISQVVESEYKKQNKNHQEAKKVVEWFLKQNSKLKKFLIEMFCENDLDKLLEGNKYPIREMKKTYNSPEAHKELNEIVIQWLGKQEEEIAQNKTQFSSDITLKRLKKNKLEDGQFYESNF